MHRQVRFGSSRFEATINQDASSGVLAVVGVLICMCIVGTACASEATGAYSSDTPVRDLFYSSRDGEISDFLARQDFVTLCMKAHGWDYSPEPLSMSGIDQYFVPVEKLRSLEYRQSFGLAYTPMEVVDDGALIYTENSEIFSGLSSSERDLWFAQEDACISEATKATSGTQFLDSLDESLRDEVLALSSLSHPDLQSELDAWSRCMTEEGFEFLHPNEAYAFAAELYQREGYNPSTGVSQEDVALALADYKCSQNLWNAIDETIARLETEAHR